MGSVGRRTFSRDSARFGIEKGHTVRYYDRIISFNRLVDNRLGKVNGKKNGVHLPPQWIEWSFKEYYKRH
jgi:hypothetical protein